MFRALPFTIIFIFPACFFLGLELGGPWTFLAVLFTFVVTPALDAVLGLEQQNPSEDKDPAAWLFNLWLLIWIPVQILLLTKGLYEVAFVPHSPLEIIGITLSAGVVTGGIGITIAHELMHRQNRFEQALAEALMTMVSYTHFCVEHVYGHHKNVATPKDPAFSRLNQSLYSYLPQTIVGGFFSAWSIEQQRNQRHATHPLSLANKRLRYSLEWVALTALISTLFGTPGLAFFLAQSLVAVLLLETINYVEHYGLERKQLENGRYERVMPRHSWNSTHRLTSYYLFNLPRHADHHYLASRPYWKLRHMENSPQMPAGYATMILVSLIPPLWWRIMNPRVQAWNNLCQEQNSTAQVPIPEPALAAQA